MGSFGGLDYMGDRVSIFAKYSFGNMGFSGSICGMNVVFWDSPTSNLDYQCQGTTQITSVISSGIMLDSDLPFGTDPDVLHRCYMDDDQVKKSPLMPYFDKTAFET